MIISRVQNIVDNTTIVTLITLYLHVLYKYHSTTNDVTL